MSDRYLCKAKRTDNGEWIIGYIVTIYQLAYIILPLSDGNFKWYNVDPSTPCQYTGLTDKNGKKIWENDIIGFLDASQYDNGYAEHYCIGQVVWDEETVSFQVTERLSCESYEALDGECEVIGNIFDNPELLEGGAE